MKKFIVFTVITALSLLHSVAFAALFDRGGGLIYDDVLNITWLQDPFYARTSGFDGDGKMTWHQAIAWVDSLECMGYTDWRLPAFWDYQNSAYTADSSEIGHLYYMTLQNTNYDGSNIGPFINLEKGLGIGTDNLGRYWTDTLAPGAVEAAYHFGWTDAMEDGVVQIPGEHSSGLTAGNTTHDCIAWAVRDGDVATVPIPEPIWLLGTGFIAFAMYRQRFIKRCK